MDRSKMKSLLKILAFSLILCGCASRASDTDPGNGKKPAETGVEADKEALSGSQSEKKELLSVEEFRSAYGLSEADASDDFIERYIDHYSLTKEKIEGDTFCGNDAKKEYAAGTVYGYTLTARGNTSVQVKDVDPEEFILKDEYIFIEFYRSMPQSDATTKELMSVDFKHMKIYYGGTRDDYSDAEGVLSADLTQEDKDEICSEIVKHINMNAGLQTSSRSRQY